MFRLSPETAADWLVRQGLPPVAGPPAALGGGVSNHVIFAPLSTRNAVLKQSLEKLQVEQEWLSDRSRIFREAAAMRWLQGKVRGGRVPAILAEDPDTCVIAMEAAPPEAEMWKTRLFRGEFDRAVAASAGTLLGSLIASSRQNTQAAEIFGDQTVFEQLRIDPYYRFTARRHPHLAPYFHTLIEKSAARRISLVHGDWSPKNILVAPSPSGTPEVWAIDWEVVHFGDPSYDAAFLFNHLLLKSIALPKYRNTFGKLAVIFLQHLTAACPQESSWLEHAALEHLPALLLARVDGKSPAEYLDEAMRARAWALGLDLISRPPRTVTEVFSR